MKRAASRSDDGLWPLVFLLIMVALASCQTYEVVTAAPVEFWLTAEAILEALILDVWAIIDLFL